jgi:hypothetical protein
MAPGAALGRALTFKHPWCKVLSTVATQHRPFSKQDALRLRVVGTGANVRGPANPGIRVEPEFVARDEELLLVAEARAMVAAYGYHYAGETATLAVGVDTGARAAASRRVNNARVTGRYERPEQACAPWGYGDSFRPAELPAAIGALGARLRAHAGFALGPLRDVTINARADAFFQLDPHVDPVGDGENVLIANLLSDAVLTFTPARPGPGLAQRRGAAEVGEKSWTDADVDCLLQRRTVVHFSGPARRSWMHAIRSGVLVDVDGVETVADWWGQLDYLIGRSPERVSIVYAFA